MLPVEVLGPTVHIRPNAVAMFAIMALVSPAVAGVAEALEQTALTHLNAAQASVTTGLATEGTPFEAIKMHKRAEH